MKVSKQDYIRLVVPQTVVRSQSRRPRGQAEEVILITFRLFEGSEFCIRGLISAQICIENACIYSSRSYEQDCGMY